MYRGLELASLLKAWSLLSSLRNRVLNAFAGMVCGNRVAVDWHDLKIVHPRAIKIGRNFSAGRGLWLESVNGRGELVIGADVNFSDHVHIGCARRVEIGDGVLVGSKVLITDHAHGEVGAGTAEALIDVPPNRRPIHSKGPVSIGRSVWLGDGVCVTAGVTIGNGAIVGANSVVVSDIPSATVWAGVPARQVWPRPAADTT